MQYGPINPKCKRFLHGGDYNPDQWLAAPEILDQDMRLMKLAHCNAMSVGIFCWTAYEPAEGVFHFDWMDRVMDKLADNDAYALLATPSAARPAWMSRKYPEVCRKGPDGRRNRHAGRHNHCFTSPVYREKVEIINRRLAERYRDHPALLVWHVSNEYGGECHCELCHAAFREWLSQRYETLDRLNQAWWAAFWSHTFTDWDLIEPVDGSILGMMLDWKRFVTHQTVDFFLHECKPLREITPDVPVTANLMGAYMGLDYWKVAEHVDVVAFDSYPRWHSADDYLMASDVGFVLDLNRSLKGGKPFMLMESTVSATNWFQVGRFKRPGMHRLTSLQAVAHGSDTVQYFQWRKGRGGAEKLHGAVVDHVGDENTRVFREVAELGVTLEKLAPVLGTSVQPEVAVIFDWENRWALAACAGPLRGDKKHDQRTMMHYHEMWKRAIPVDVINMDCDLSPYRLVVAPMLYMVREDVAKRIEEFVAGGGTFITTYLAGMVNENDLCHLGGFPGPLRKVMGVWAEETDAFYDHDTQSVIAAEGNELGLAGEYEVVELADIIRPEGADVLATYGHDFYAGQAALTVNHFGRGEAYYIASRNGEDFLSDFYGGLVKKLGLKPVLDAQIPDGVSVQMRTDGRRTFLFLMNFRPGPRTLDLGGASFTDLETQETVTGAVELDGYGVRVVEKA